MASSLKINDLALELQRDIADYTKIFGLKMSNGFDEKRNGDLIVMPTKDKVPLVRDTLSPILQVGRTGSTNFTDDALSLKSRIGEIKPFKADLRIDEKTLYAWTKSYLAHKKMTDPTDIYSFEAMQYYMSRIFAQAGKDMTQALYKGVYNATGGVGGVNLFDGLGIKLTKGVLTEANGGVGDIPTTNMFAAAATITQANILSEIKKLVDTVVASETLAEYIEEDATLYMSFKHFAFMVNAVSELPVTAGNQVVFKDGKDWKLVLLPNTIIKYRPMMSGTEKQFWTPSGNLYYLAPEGTAEDVASIDIEKQDRALKIYLDGEAATEYADGRLIVMNNK